MEKTTLLLFSLLITANLAGCSSSPLNENDDLHCGLALLTVEENSASSNHDRRDARFVRQARDWFFRQLDGIPEAEIKDILGRAKPQEFVELVPGCLRRAGYNQEFVDYMRKNR